MNPTELFLEQSSASPSPSSSVSSSQFSVNSDGAGSSSTATATSPTGQSSNSSKSVFTPGATSSSGSASANTSSDTAGTSTLVSAPVGLRADYVLGTDAADILVGSRNQEILIGYEGADTFVLDTVGVRQLADADLIVDFNWAEGDRFKLGSGLSISDIRFEVTDLDQNGKLDSTVIRLGDAGPILGIAQNTVDVSGRTLLSINMF